MKNSSLLLVLLIGICSSKIYGQEIDSLKNKSIVKLELFLGGVQFEQRVSKKTSFEFTIQYAYENLYRKDQYNFQITPEYKIYFSSKKPWPLGFSSGIYLFYKDYIVARDMESNGGMIYSKDLVKTSGIGLKSSYNLRLTDRIPFEVSMGFGYNIFCDVAHKFGVNIIDESTHYIGFLGRFSIGYIF